MELVRGINPQPADYKSDALPIELRQHISFLFGDKIHFIILNPFCQYFFFDFSLP
jgi:hypothetical protein